MPVKVNTLLEQYVAEVKRIYGDHLKQIILFGSYARGDFQSDSDIDIMILTDVDQHEEDSLSHALSDATFDFNMDHDTDIKPITKDEAFFRKWVENYPFYANINREGVVLYGAA